MSTFVKTIGIVVAHPNKEAALKALLDSMVIPSRAEPGNLQYDLWQDTSDTRRFVLDELYVNLEAIAQHRASAHFRNYLEKINELAERNAIVLHPLRVA